MSHVPVLPLAAPTSPQPAHTRKRAYEPPADAKGDRAGGEEADESPLNRPRYAHRSASTHTDSSHHRDTSGAISDRGPSIASTDSDAGSSHSPSGGVSVTSVDADGDAVMSTSPVHVHAAGAARPGEAEDPPMSDHASPTPAPVARVEFIDLTSDDETLVSPDVEQKEPFYLPIAMPRSDPLTSRHLHTQHHHHQHLAHGHHAHAPPAAPSHASAAPSAATHHPAFFAPDPHLDPEHDLLPCEVSDCHYFLRPDEYHQHMLLHHFNIVRRQQEMEQQAEEEHLRLKQLYTRTASLPTAARLGTPSSHQSSLLPCDFFGCGRLIEADQYLAHQQGHLEEERNPKHAAAHQPAASAAGRSSASVHTPLAQSSSRSHGSTAVGRPWGSRYHASPPLAAGGGDPNYVCDIIPLLHRIFARRKDLAVYLCNPIQFFYRSKGDGGFGCGYKNIQTLCSALLQFQLYRDVLFDGRLGKHAPATGSRALHQRRPGAADSSHGAGGAAAAASGGSPTSPPAGAPQPLPRMPTISALQSYIDQAHARGFDVVGAAQVGQLRNSKTWIGAVEAHALLCSYGVRSELIDFKSSHVGLMEYVWNYFAERTHKVGDEAAQGGGPFGVEEQPDEKARGKASERQNQHGQGDHSPMANLDTHARAYHAGPPSPRDARPASTSGPTPPSVPTLGFHPSTFVPPLYFQHQGHSRTIIGIVHNKRTSRYRLLVLDPDMTGGGPKLVDGLRSQDPTPTLRTLYRTEDSLRAKEYQMVMVSSYGLMAPEEQEKSKRPFSTVISAIEGEGVSLRHAGVKGGKAAAASGQTKDGGRAGHRQGDAQQAQSAPGRTHDRGAGPASGKGNSSSSGGGGAHSDSPATSARKLRVEQREVDERAAARRVGETQEEADARVAKVHGDHGGKSKGGDGSGKRDSRAGARVRFAPSPARPSAASPAAGSSAASPSPSLPRAPSSTAFHARAISCPYATMKNIPVIPPSRILAMPPAGLHSALVDHPVTAWHRRCAPAAHPSAYRTASGAMDDMQVHRSAHAPARSNLRPGSPAGTGQRPTSCSRVPETSRLLLPKLPTGK